MDRRPYAQDAAVIAEGPCGLATGMSPGMQVLQRPRARLLPIGDCKTVLNRNFLDVYGILSAKYEVFEVIGPWRYKGDSQAPPACE
ncbi:UNVERIFIED_CONTAM: hypothetical protein Sradi_0702500 [Sesamum radiatum]|uniref:Uncharacterized protein n=1 Tax=Sesamum radiatum TaxID=300843 RepID=A0AAW2VMV7_SESRA